jgi:cobalt/nickel transport system permease protein
MDDLGRLDTPIHRLDARAKAATTLAFVGVVMSFPRYAVTALFPFLLYPLALVTLGRIPWPHLWRKMLVAAPFALVVGILNPLMDQRPAVAVGSLVVTGGWISFLSILIRYALTVGAALALVSCTGTYRLGAGLERLGVPQVFVAQLLFLYRYLFVAADQGARTMRAVALRSAGGRAASMRVYGSVVGHLLVRAMDRAENVHHAMVARGFDGNIRVAHPTRFRVADGAFVFGWLVFFTVARIWNLADEVGRLFLGGRAL